MSTRPVQPALVLHSSSAGRGRCRTDGTSVAAGWYWQADL